MRSTNIAWRLLMLGVMILAASCSTMPRNFAAPRISISDLAPKDIALLDQRFDVKIRIQNPNEMDMRINGLKFDIELNEQEFANGMSGQSVNVPRFGSETVSVEVFTTLVSFLRQIKYLGGGAAQKVRYRLKGTAYVVSPSQFKAPFDEKGDIDFNVQSKAEN